MWTYDEFIADRPAAETPTADSAEIEQDYATPSNGPAVPADERGWFVRGAGGKRYGLCR